MLFASKGRPESLPRDARERWGTPRGPLGIEVLSVTKVITRLKNFRVKGSSSKREYSTLKRLRSFGIA